MVRRGSPFTKEDSMTPLKRAVKYAQSRKQRAKRGERAPICDKSVFNPRIGQISKYHPFYTMGYQGHPKKIRKHKAYADKIASQNY